MVSFFASGTILFRLFCFSHICLLLIKINQCFWKTSAAGATPEGKDHSLFYGNEKELTQVTKERTFLPSDLYGSIVRDTVVCCLDIVLTRYNPETSRRECLLVLRSSEPAKGIWWLPGGRLVKGETFFDCAKRKAMQETGISDVKPVQVLGVWNTFFPRSSWDTPESQGTQTVNPVVLVEINSSAGTTQQIKLDAQSTGSRWITLDPAEAIANNEDKYVIESLQRLHAWDPGYATRKA